MEETKPAELKRYEKLSKTERRTLRKEYYNAVNPRAKILWAIYFLFLSVMLAALGFLFYYMINGMAFNENIGFFWPFSIVFIPIATITVAIAMQAHNGFAKWLLHEKNLLSPFLPHLSKAWADKTVTRDPASGEPRLFGEMPKDEKKALRKEYYDVIAPRERKMWRAIAIAYLILAVFITGVIIFNLILWICFNKYTNWIWLNAAMLACLGFAAFVFIKTVIFREFLIWLEYEKNIMVKQPKTKEISTASPKR